MPPSTASTASMEAPAAASAASWVLGEAKVSTSMATCPPCQPSELLQELGLVHPGDLLGPGQTRRLELEGGEAVLLEVVERPRQAKR